MRKKWLNDKQPDENGDYVLVIENDMGNRVSTFKGQSIEEITEALADSQIAANKQLGKLLRPDRGREAPLKIQPKDIPPGDRLRLATEITDPSKVVEAVTEIVTAQQGAPPAEVGRRVGSIDQTDADTYYRAEAEAFVAEHPEYYPVQQNQEDLFRALAASNYDLTRNNLAIVFERLMDEGKLIPWPDDSAPLTSEAAPPSAPVIEPRSRPKPTVTRADLERMSRAEYNDRLRDPAFRRAVDALA
jgi:hypothetical protein